METRRHYFTGHIVGFTYWEGCLALNELSVGTELKLARETDNKFDPYAVALYYKEYKLGFLPRNLNHEISKFLEMGYADMFEARVNRLSKDEHPENQVGIIVYIKSA